MALQKIDCDSIVIYCEHFIFTSGKTKEKNGYQIIAKSNNISPKLLVSLNNYMHPIDIDFHEFTKSKSMITHKNEITFTIAKNIGIGHDGRSDTIYSHTIIVDINDFKKFDYDTRPLEKLYVENKSDTQIEPLKIEPRKQKPDFNCIDILGIEKFEYFFQSVLTKKKIAIHGVNDLNLLQSLLSLLPPSLRLISFSTTIANSTKQSKFDLVQTNSIKSSFKKYEIIDLKINNTNYNKRHDLFDRCFYYLIDVINSKNVKNLLKIYEFYEMVPINNYKIKLPLAIMMWMNGTKKSYSFNEQMLFELVLILEKMSSLFMNNNLKKFKRFLPNDVMKEYVRINKINKIIIDYSDAILTFKTIFEMFVKIDNDENRMILFHKLVKLRTNDFELCGSQILVDAIGHNFDSQIICGFLKYDNLHECIIKAFNNPNLDKTKKKQLFYLLIINSLNDNRIFLGKLFSLKIFDYNQDISDYYDIIIKLFKMPKFYEKTNPKLIFIILDKIYDNLYEQFKYDNVYMRRIFCALLNIINYLLLVRDFELYESVQDINSMKKNLEHIFKNKYSNIKLSTKFEIFDQIPISMIKIIFPHGEYSHHDRVTHNIKYPKSTKHITHMTKT